MASPFISGNNPNFVGTNRNADLAATEEARFAEEQAQRARDEIADRELERIKREAARRRELRELLQRTEPTPTPEPAFRPPWNDGDQPKQIHSNKNEVFFAPFFIDPDRWNRFFPYRLLIIDVTDNNKTVGPGGIDFQGINSFEEINSEGGIEYVITQQARNKSWEMVLPITPQQLQVTDQYSINTSATMRGVIEEHNGLKFKMISASGTTGIWPLKPTLGDKVERPSVAGSVFGGTIEAANNLANQAGSVKSIATGEHPRRPSNAEKPGESSVGTEFNTGYYQALYMGQFLERYAQAKKNPEWKNYRLAFDMPKQNQTFVVTPVSFSLKQDQQSPGEYKFNFQFKAWKRVKLNETPFVESTQLPDLGDPNIYQRAVGTIEQTRRTLGSALNLVRAVRSDAQAVFNNLRELSLVVKDAAGLVFTAIDLPRQIVNDLKSTIEDSIENISSAFTPPSDRFRDQPGLQGSVNKITNVGGLSPQSKAGTVAQSITNQRRANEGLSREAVQAGALGTDAAQRTQVDTLNNVFENPEENFDFFNTINVDQLQLTPEQQIAIEDDQERTSLITINDLRETKQDLLTLSNQISNNFGALDSTYASIFGLPEPQERSLPLTVEENEVLASIFETIQVIDILTSTKQFDSLNEESSLEFVGGIANEANINFNTPPSKLLAPVPFGSSIEEISAKYLRDADRFLEIATLNNLRSPYIDEEGFIYDLLSNASGRQFNVNDTEALLFIGQKIILQSDIVPPFSRKITNVEQIGDGNFLVTVDGLNNLGNLTTADGARMQTFLPGTVNSQNQIYIPSDEPSSVEDDQVFNIPGVSDNQLAKLSKVDFLLTEEFDIAINSVGDFRLATGLTNLVQALKMKIKTQRGTLLRHLDYGLGLEYGVSVADINNGLIINELNRLVTEDERFQAVTQVSLRLSGSTLGIDMVVQLANNNGVLPVNFDLKVS